MTLQEIFDQLAYGEFRTLSVGEDGIQPKSYASMINHINLGLNALYKRFPLKEGTLKLNLHAGIYTYKLDMSRAVNNLMSFEDIQYVVDTEEDPFQGDILKVERVYTDNHTELGLNDINDEYSILTPSLTTIRVHKDIVDGSKDLPDYLKTSGLEIVYRADHPRIKYTGEEMVPASVNIDLPYSHLEPLLYFIASRIHNPIGMQNEFHSGNNYASKYERACQQLEQLNIRVDQSDQTNDRLRAKGWV